MLLVSCSFIKFERGPYAIRDLQVVYSAQEDVTFYSWRLRADADVDRVRFELWSNEDERFVPIELGEALFPAQPYSCGGDFLCFQYQVDGLEELPEVPPVRSIHEDQGIFAGPDTSFERVIRTFDATPLAIEDNRAIDARIDSWFVDAEFPLKRDYEWQFVELEDGRCPVSESFAADDLGGFAVVAEPIEVDSEWTESDVCIVVRPSRRVGPTVPVVRRLKPSAVTTFERQSYVPPRIDAPTLYAVLVDMEIPNTDRCAQVKDFLFGTLESAIEARGEAVRLGIYTPLSGDDGQPTTGCEQGPRDTYPIDLILSDAIAAERSIEPQDARLLLIYVNNVEIPPGDRIVNQFVELSESLFEETDLSRYTWAIGSNAILDLVAWDFQTGWRPVEDETFRQDIVAFSRSALPFSTMDHSELKEISIEAPPDTAPLYFKLCQTSPFPYSAVGVTPGFPQFDRRTPAVEWPEEGQPFYTVPIEPQILVANTEYVQRRVDAVVEVCTAFCDGPFRTESGVDYDSWLRPGVQDPMEVCRWTR